MIVNPATRRMEVIDLDRASYNGLARCLKYNGAKRVLRALLMWQSVSLPSRRSPVVRSLPLAECLDTDPGLPLHVDQERLASCGVVLR